MNDSITNATSISISELTQIAYNDYIITLIQCAMLSLVIYTTILAIPQEMVYMWLSPKPLSIPSLLYAITRYTNVLDQAFRLLSDISPPESLCGNLANTENALAVLGYVGVQGLLIIRAYSLCGGNKVMTVILALLFGGGLSSELYEIIITRGCFQSSPDTIGASLLIAALIENICTALTDLAVFSICLWKVWGTWRLKRETSIQSRNDLVSVVLKQTVSRFCFVIIFTTTVIIIDQVKNDTTIAIMGGIQHGLSIILLADFTLDLRQKNSAAIQAVDISLPTIQIRSVTNYIHQSILVEMGDHETSVHTRPKENDELSPESPEIAGIGRERSA